MYIDWKPDYTEEELFIMFGDKVPECFKNKNTTK